MASRASRVLTVFFILAVIPTVVFPASTTEGDGAAGGAVVHSSEPASDEACLFQARFSLAHGADPATAAASPGKHGVDESVEAPMIEARLEPSPAGSRRASTMQRAVGRLKDAVRGRGEQTTSTVFAERAIFALVLIIGLSIGSMILEQTNGNEQDKGTELCGPEPLDEDAYGLAIESLVHNSVMLATGKGTLCHWITRIVMTQGILFLNMGLQLFLLSEVLKLCTSMSVHNIRDAYDKYEFHMYGRQESHTWITSTGKHRGLDEFFEPANFATLPEDLKPQVCNIPFSQPMFFMVIIFIWSLMCVKEIKVVFDTFRTFIVSTPRCESMATAICQKPNAEQYIASRNDNSPPIMLSPTTGPRRSIASLQCCSDGFRQEVLINQLTRQVKAYMIFCILLPRLLITLILCYTGCRWLAATNDFMELVLNAVALEFIMGLKNLLYVSLVPQRNKRDLQNTWMHPCYKREPANYGHFLGSFIWFFVAALWSGVYTYHLQQVLPEYNWDVRVPCEQWLLEATRT